MASLLTPPPSSCKLLLPTARPLKRASRITCSSHSSEEIPLDVHSSPASGVCGLKIKSTMPVSSLHEDWRSFRAALVASQEQQLSCTEEHFVHEIPLVEPGCVLVATSHLDKHPLLRRSVILVLEVSEESYRGIILNKRMPFPLEEDMDPEVIAMSKLGCPTYLSGSPTSLLHSKPQIYTLTRNKGLRGYNKIVNGLYLGDKNAFSTTAESLRRGYAEADDVRICVGDMEWDTTQLTVEIQAFRWWKAVSCSTSALLNVSAGSLWESLSSALHLEVAES